MPIFKRNYFRNGIGSLTGRNTSSKEISINSGASASIVDDAPGIRILNDTVYYENVYMQGGGGINGNNGNGGQQGGEGCGGSALEFNQIHTEIGRTTNGSAGNNSQNTSLFGYSSGYGNNGNNGNPPQPNPGPGNPGNSNTATISNSQIQVADSDILQQRGGPAAVPSLPIPQGGQRRLPGYPDNPTFATKGDRSQGGAVWGSIPGANRKFKA